MLSCHVGIVKGIAHAFDEQRAARGPGSACPARPRARIFRRMAISLFDKDSGKRLGAVGAATWAHVTGILQKETPSDTDYWIDAGTLELLEKDAQEVSERPAAGPFRTDEPSAAEAPASELAAFVAMLRKALGEREGFEVTWREEG